MAVGINVGGTKFRRSDYFFVDPYQVVVAEGGRGRVFGVSPEAVVERAISLKKEGQLQPVVARRLPDQRLKLTAGFTRCAAARLIREGFRGPDGTIYDPDPEFMLQVKLSDVNDEEAFIQNVVENAQRNQTSDIDDAHNQGKMREQYGMPDAEIAGKYGCSVSRVSKLRKLLMLPMGTQRLIHDGMIATQTAIDMLDLPPEEQDAIVQKAKETGKINGSEVRASVRDHILRDSNPDQSPTGTRARKKGGEKSPKGKKVVRTMKEFRTDLTKLANADVTDTVLGRFIEDLIEYLDGRKTDVALKNAVKRLRSTE